MPRLAPPLAGLCSALTSSCSSLSSRSRFRTPMRYPSSWSSALPLHGLSWASSGAPSGSGWQKPKFIILSSMLGCLLPSIASSYTISSVVRSRQFFAKNAERSSAAAIPSSF